MDIALSKTASFQISTDKLFSIISATVGGDSGREDDEHPLKPGPWDPVIRHALERMNIFGQMFARHSRALFLAHSLKPGKPSPREASAFLYNHAAKETFSPDLQQSLANASSKFAETGLSRMT